MKTKTVLALLAGLLVGFNFTQAQSYRVLHEFEFGLYQTGREPHSTMVRAGDGTLFGVVRYGSQNSYGGVFRVNPDGTGFTLLKRFTSYDEAAYPVGGLVLAGSTLYGTAPYGGTNGQGAIFKLNTNGTGFAILHAFSGSDGASPSGGLVLSGSTLYGTTLYYGGSGAGYGSVFQMDTNGTGFSVLHIFGETNGAYPQGSLIISGNTLFGTTPNGGTNGQGVAFKLNVGGGGFTLLKHFAGSGTTYPRGGLALSGSMLFGAGEQGGANGAGAIYQLDTNGNNFAVIKSFAALSNGTNSDGAYPDAELMISGATLYGTTTGGGSAQQGTVFKISTNGTGFTVLRSLSGSDGATPYAGLAVAGATLFGSTAFGGNRGGGTLFSVNTDGTGFAVVRHFATSDGASPYAPVVLSGSTLYGTAPQGGGDGYNGTIYKVNTDGTGFGILKNFDYSEGSSPYPGLALADGALFGTATSGGANNGGVLFKIQPDGSSFTVLKHFPATADDGSGNFTNSDGAFPENVMVSGSTIYGVTYGGGPGGNGVIFRVETNGTAYSVLKSFPPSATNATAAAFTNAGGAHPEGRLLLAGSTLYGTAVTGGNAGYGTVFKLNTNGTGFTVLMNFSTNEGGHLQAGLVLSGSTLYGTADGGDLNGGTIFKVETNGTGFAILKGFSYTNYSDGIQPIGQLLLSNGLLYGTLYQYAGVGAIYQINTDGSGYKVLKGFNGDDGAFLRAGVIRSGDLLFGTTASGGTAQAGVVYRFSLVPELKRPTVASGIVTLTWDTFSTTNYRVQFTSPVTKTNWTDLPGDVVGNGSTVSYTDPLTSSNRFYRLHVLP